jgi:hypothetical protein
MGEHYFYSLYVLLLQITSWRIFPVDTITLQLPAASIRLLIHLCFWTRRRLRRDLRLCLRQIVAGSNHVNLSGFSGA